MMPSDSGSRRAASGGALERKKTARATRTRRAATIKSVLRVRRLMRCGRHGQEFRARIQHSGTGPLFDDREGVDLAVTSIAIQIVSVIRSQKTVLPRTQFTAQGDLVNTRRKFLGAEIDGVSGLTAGAMEFTALLQSKFTGF